MTPVISLVLVCGLVAAITVVRRRMTERVSTSDGYRWLSLGIQLVWCELSAGLVWLLQGAFWPEYPERLAVLGLLSLEGMVAGLVSIGVLYRAGWFHQSKPRSAAALSNQNSGIIRVRKLAQIRGTLPPGVQLYWNERRGRWSMAEVRQEEER